MGNAAVPPRSRNITQRGGLPNPHTLPRIPKLPPTHPKPTSKQARPASKQGKQASKQASPAKPASKQGQQASKQGQQASKAIQQGRLAGKQASKPSKASKQAIKTIQQGHPAGKQASPAKPASNSSEFTYFTYFTYTGPPSWSRNSPICQPAKPASKQAITASKLANNYIKHSNRSKHNTVGRWRQDYYREREDKALFCATVGVHRCMPWGRRM